MKTVLQRVSKAEVSVDAASVGSIQTGLLVFIGIEEGDDTQTGEEMIDRLVRYRVFPGENGKMDLNLSDVDGDLLLIPNFTLCADTASSGNRPGFGPAAAPERAEELFHEMVAYAREQADGRVESGEFGAMMNVDLVNDGPVTFTFSS